MISAMYFFAGALGQTTELWSFALLVPPVLLDAGRALLISVLFGVANLVVSLPGIFFVRSGRAGLIPPEPAPLAPGSTTE